MGETILQLSMNNENAQLQEQILGYLVLLLTHSVYLQIIPDTIRQVSRSPLPGHTFQKEREIIGIESVYSYPICDNCQSNTKLHNKTCTRYKTEYEEHENPNGFRVELLVQEEGQSEDQATAIKMFTNQLTHLISPNKLPKTTDDIKKLILKPLKMIKFWWSVIICSNSYLYFWDRQ